MSLKRPLQQTRNELLAGKPQPGLQPVILHVRSKRLAIWILLQSLVHDVHFTITRPSRLARSAEQVYHDQARHLLLSLQNEQSHQVRR